MSDEQAREEEVDAVVVEEAAPGGDVVVHDQGGGSAALATLWGTRDAKEIVRQVGDVADALGDVIQKQGLSKNLGGNKDHVEIEGWQTAATLLGLQAMTIVTIRVEPKTTFQVRTKRKKWGMLDGKRQVIEESDHEWTVEGWSYEAVAEVRTMDGRTVGRGEAICSREEKNWFDSEESAVKGMAQTRAQSRALKQALGFIVGMAGYNTTPKEEMDAAGVKAPDAVQLAPATKEQNSLLSDALIWLLPQKEAEAIYNAVASLFDGTMPGLVADAIVATIGARKVLDEPSEETGKEGGK